MNAAMPPAFCASAITCSAMVVLPEDSGPKISLMRPRGNPPTPERVIERNGAGRNHRHRNDGVLRPQPQDRAFAELLFDLAEGRVLERARVLFRPWNSFRAGGEGHFQYSPKHKQANLFGRTEASRRTSAARLPRIPRRPGMFRKALLSVKNLATQPDRHAFRLVAS